MIIRPLKAWEKGKKKRAENAGGGGRAQIHPSSPSERADSHIFLPSKVPWSRNQQAQTQGKTRIFTNVLNNLLVLFSSKIFTERQKNGMTECCRLPLIPHKYLKNLKTSGIIRLSRNLTLQSKYCFIIVINPVNNI